MTKTNKTSQIHVVCRGLHASCFACFDPIGCIFKDQAGGGVCPWLKALGRMQEDIGSRLAILYHITCTIMQFDMSNTGR